MLLVLTRRKIVAGGRELQLDDVDDVCTSRAAQIRSSMSVVQGGFL
jgi:hypothetical protein